MYVNTEDLTNFALATQDRDTNPEDRILILAEHLDHALRSLPFAEIPAEWWEEAPILQAQAESIHRQRCLVALWSHSPDCCCKLCLDALDLIPI